MKKSIISLVVLMSTLGTTTSFGKTNGQPRNEQNQPRMEQRDNRGSHMQRDNRPQMQREPMHREPGRPQPMPKPQPQPEPRPVDHHNSNVGDVVGGVVVGTVIGTVLGSLIH